MVDTGFSFTAYKDIFLFPSGRKSLEKGNFYKYLLLNKDICLVIKIFF